MARRSKIKIRLVAVGALLCARQAAAFPFPTPFRKRDEQVGIAALSTAQIAAFRPYTHYASTGYCSPVSTLAWDCGENCEANPGFQPVASGGDGDLTQFWYAGFDPRLKEVIVAHQGTDTTKLLPILTDGDFLHEPLNRTLFPGVDRRVVVHGGFARAQSRSAPDVLAAVQKAVAKFKTNKVTVAGYSLGAAIGLLDALYLPLHIPHIKTRFVGYGLPRVGNMDFADYVDAQRRRGSLSVARVNNKRDVVPILPGRFLGFRHPSGEVHIDEAGAWLACPGCRRKRRTREEPQSPSRRALTTTTSVGLRGIADSDHTLSLGNCGSVRFMRAANASSVHASVQHSSLMPGHLMPRCPPERS